MALILSIETSTPICSVAVHLNDKLLVKSSLHVNQSHSSSLHLLITNTLKGLNKRPSDLDAIAISKGPGSYTGLRIGVSSAKGLCYSLGIPLIAISTLEAMAEGIKKYTNHYLCPMLDARRMEVYTALFDQNGKVLMATQPLILDQESFSNYLSNNRICFFGDGSNKWKEVVASQNAFFIDSVVPDAEFVGQLAVKEFNTQSFEDLAYFEPSYLKEFRATKPKSLI